MLAVEDVIHVVFKTGMMPEREPRFSRQLNGRRNQSRVGQFAIGARGFAATIPGAGGGVRVLGADMPILVAIGRVQSLVPDSMSSANPANGHNVNTSGNHRIFYLQGEIGGGIRG